MHPQIHCVSTQDPLLTSNQRLGAWKECFQAKAGAEWTQLSVSLVSWCKHLGCQRMHCWWLRSLRKAVFYNIGSLFSCIPAASEKLYWETPKVMLSLKNFHHFSIYITFVISGREFFVISSGNKKQNMAADGDISLLSSPNNCNFPLRLEPSFFF